MKNIVIKHTSLENKVWRYLNLTKGLFHDFTLQEMRLATIFIVNYNKDGIMTLTKESKIDIATKMSIEPTAINTMIHRLKNKGFFSKADKVMKISPKFLFSLKAKEIRFIFEDAKKATKANS